MPRIFYYITTLNFRRFLIFSDFYFRELLYGYLTFLADGYYFSGSEFLLIFEEYLDNVK